MAILSLIGIFAGLVLMIFLCYKGHSIIWVAPLCAFLVVLFSLGAGLGEGRSLLSAYTVDYMTGVGEYFITWFPAFLLGAVYGKIMDLTGAAKALSDVIVRLIGPRFVVLAVLIPCMLLTYGGVSLFVVVFVMYPMGSAIYRAANVPRTLLPAAIAFGSFGLTMTCIPGTPQIQNLIPMEYFGTTAAAAPWLGITAALLTGIPGYLYLDWRVRKARQEGRGYESGIVFTGTGTAAGAGIVDGGTVAGPGITDNGTAVSGTGSLAARITSGDIPGNGTAASEMPAWKAWLCGLLPLLVVFVILNVLKWNVIIALLAGILVCCLLQWKKIRILPTALTEGAKGSVTAIMNSACAVGFGSVIRIVPGFVLLTGLLIGRSTSPVSLFLSECISTSVLAGTTGSASGGLSIALAAFSDSYLQMAAQLGISPELLHRFAAIAAGSLDKLPHNGAVITLLAVSHCAHKESYRDIFVVSVLIPLAVMFLLALVWGVCI